MTEDARAKVRHHETTAREAAARLRVIAAGDTLGSSAIAEIRRLCDVVEAADPVAGEWRTVMGLAAMNAVSAALLVTNSLAQADVGRVGDALPGARWIMIALAVLGGLGVPVSGVFLLRSVRALRAYRTMQATG